MSTESTTPVERAVDVLYRHVRTTIATVAAGLPSSRALRDVTGPAATCEVALLTEIADGGPLTRQGLDVAVHRALSALLDRDEIARVLRAASWPDGGTDGFPTRKVAGMLADALIAHLTGAQA